MIETSSGRGGTTTTVGVRPPRRALILGAAWTAPVVALGSQAPALAASSTYTGPAFQVIGAGSGATNSLKIYALGAGPWRGTGNLAPGFRFGRIGTGSYSATRTITLTFTPAVTPATAPKLSDIFDTTGPSLGAATASGGSYVYSIGVGSTSADPRASTSGVASIVVKSTVTSAALGIFEVTETLPGGRTSTGRFVLAATYADNNDAATDLQAQPTY